MSATAILAVDDEPEHLEMLASELSKRGYRVLEASSSMAALALLSAHPEIRLIVADVMMPGINGLQLGDAVSQIRPDLPFIFVTGHAGTYPDALTDRIVVTKPFVPEQLVEAVEHALQPGR